MSEIDKQSTLDKLKVLSAELDTWEHSVQRETFLLLNGFTDMVVVTDNKGIIKFANPSSFRVLGYDPVELIGQSIDVLTHGDVNHKERIDDYLERKISKIVGVGRSVMAKHKKGASVPVYLYIGELKGEDEHMFVGVVHKV
jgi:PAS domain S-box-containing protein